MACPLSSLPMDSMLAESCSSQCVMAIMVVETHHMCVMLKGPQSCGEGWEEALIVLLQVSVIHCGNYDNL